MAHFRPIKEDDIELIKQNVKHALVGIEECLSEMTRTYNVVPTNTKDNWYRGLITLGTEQCEMQLFQSNNEEWLRVEVIFKSKILSRTKHWEEFISYQVLNLMTPAIIPQYPAIAKFATYISEYVPLISMNKEQMPFFSKNISLVFSRHVLEENYESIQASVKDMLLQIQNESELVQKDNLAKGKLIESVRTFADLKKEGEKENWVIEKNPLTCLFREDDPAEYWGDLGLHHRDFIGGISKYPWMPSYISSKESVFD